MAGKTLAKIQKADHDLLLIEYQLQKRLNLLEGKDSMAKFIRATDPEFEWNWHHHRICEKLDRIISGDLKRLIITMPPRHGKSEIVSRKMPAYYFGHFPDDQVIMIGHGSGFASKFNRATQKIMKSQEYREIFPVSYLNQVNPETGMKPTMTNTSFELPLTDGVYLSTGYMAGVMGAGADLLIIDDPIRNKEEAESDAFRTKLWEEYTSTLKTRLMPEGKIIICLTRWHEGDLVGKLLEQMNDPTLPNADNWEVLSLEAIKETDNPEDPREIGEALWPSWYPLPVLLSMKDASEDDFSALYQQNPASTKGSVVSKEWFRYYRKSDIRLPIPDFHVDSADKVKKSSDRTAILGYCRVGNDLYLTHGDTIKAKFPDRVRFIIEVVENFGDVAGSMVHVEPKSSGVAIVQFLQEDTKLNIVEDVNPRDDKMVRLKSVSSRIKSGRVYLPEGEGWVKEFLLEVCGFPKRPHDDYVDCLVGAIQKTLGGATIEMTSFNYGEQ